MCPCLTSQPKWRWGATGCVYGMDVKHRNKRIEALGACYGGGSGQRSGDMSHRETEKRAVGGGSLGRLLAAGWSDRRSVMYNVMSQCVGDGGGAKAVRLSCPSEGYNRYGALDTVGEAGSLVITAASRRLPSEDWALVHVDRRETRR